MIETIAVNKLCEAEPNILYFFIYLFFNDLFSGALDIIITSAKMYILYTCKVTLHQNIWHFYDL